MNFKIIFNAFLKSKCRDIVKFLSAFSAWKKQHQDNLPFIEQTLDEPHVFSTGETATPLEFATLVGSIDLVDIFLEAGANPNGRNNNGLPLLYASQRKHEQIVSALCKYKVTVSLNALKLAIENESYDIVQILLERLLENSIYLAASEKNLEVDLIEAGLFLVLERNASLQMKNLFIVYALKKPHQNQAWMLEAAIEYNCVTLLKELIKRKVDLHALRDVETEDGRFISLTMVQLACKHNRYHMIKMLLENGFNSNFRVDGLRIIHQCIMFSAAIDSLIASGAQVNFVPGDRCSPVLLAVVGGDKSVLYKLLAAGANPNGALEDDAYPISVISRARDFKIIAKMLLSHSAFDVETLFATDKSQEFPLCTLLRDGGVNLLKFILMLPGMNSVKAKVLVCGIIFGLFSEMPEIVNESIRHYTEHYGLEAGIYMLKDLLQRVGSSQEEFAEGKAKVVDGISLLFKRLSDEMAAASIGESALTDQASSGRRSPSARAYIELTHGWTKANFESQQALLKENKKKLVQSTDGETAKEPNILPSTETWFDGKLTDNMFELIENSQNGVKYFLCIPDEPKDANSDCSRSLELFRKQSRFCFGKTVKDISDINLEATIKIFQQAYPKVAINYELKLKSTKDRLFCAEFKSDNGTAVLLLNVKFSKDGAHTNGHVKDLQVMFKDAVIEVDLDAIFIPQKSPSPSPGSSR